MKRLLVVMALVLTGAAVSSTQDLKGSWERIQAFFLGGMHDSVVVHVPVFVAELRKHDLKPQISVAWFHQAVSLAHLGREVESDSTFARAMMLAREGGENARAEEIRTKQVQLYIGFATRPSSDPASAIRFLTKAANVLGPGGDPRMRAVVHYQIAQLRRASGDGSGALRAGELSLAALEEGVAEPEMRQAVVSLLTELYVEGGMSAKAEELARRGGSARGRVEYAIRLAERAEAEGRPGEADRLLSSVQHDILQEGDDARVVEFAKKRYSLYERNGDPARGYDTVKVLAAGAVSASPSVQFHLSRLMALLAIQKGDLGEAGRQTARMRSLSTPALEPLLHQTTGDIAYLQGDNAQAIGSYRAALGHPSAFDEASRFSIINNLGLALTRNGEYGRALKVFEELSTAARHDPVYRIQADLNAGIVLMKTDSLASAGRLFERARAEARTGGLMSLQVMASLRLAESHRRSGMEGPAASLYDEVRRDQERLSDPFNRIQVLQALAAQAQTTGAHWSAVTLLRQALHLAEGAGATGFVAPLATDLGDNYFLADSLEQAMSFYETALKFYGETEDRRTKAELLYKKAQCALGLSRYDLARTEANRGMDLVRRSSETGGDLEGLGHATLAFIDYSEGRVRGDIRSLLRAEQEIAEAVRILSARVAGTLVKSEQESQSLRNVNAFRLSVDIAAALHEATADPRYLELAFNTSEQSRAEAFVSDVGAQLVGKLQDPSLRDLAVAAGQLLEQGSRDAALAVDLTQPSGTRGIKAKPAPDERVARDYERIVRQLSDQNNKASQLVSVNTLTLPSVRGLLSENDVMLNYYVSLERIYLFIVWRGGQELRSIAWKPEELAAAVEQYRASIHNLAGGDHLLVARVLFDSLIAPASHRIAGKSLVIVPSARLNNLPFSGLHDGKQFLVETHRLSVLPNASTLQFVRGGKSLPPAPSILAMGNPANPRVTRLPGSEQEVTSIQGIHGRSVVFTGQDASEANARRHMAGFDIVHFACHGLFNYDYPYLSSLALSPGGGNDGFLEVHEIYNLNLTRTSLVILSACETGLAKIRKNDDVIGLVRGFFYAGVPSLAASLWKVDDFATATLMSHYHALLQRGASRAGALQKAQQQLLRSETTRHPYYWAAFVLYGNGE